MNCAEFIISSRFSLNDCEQSETDLSPRHYFSNQFRTISLCFRNMIFTFQKNIAFHLFAIGVIRYFTIYNIIAYLIYFCMHC